MPSSKPSKNDQIDTKLLPNDKIGAVLRSTQFPQIPILQCVAGVTAIQQHVTHELALNFGIFEQKLACFTLGPLCRGRL